MRCGGNIPARGAGCSQNFLEDSAMRKVVPGEEVCHLWAHQSQTEARSPTRNIYFTDHVLYSYGAHFPIGAVFKGAGKDAVPVYVLNPERYSATTSKHQSWARRAVNHSARVYSL